MSEEETPQSEGVSLSAEMRAQSGLAVRGFVASGSTTGDQSFEYAGQQIEVEDAAHRRRVEQQRLDHDLREEATENKWRRVRENVTFGVVVFVVVGVFVATVNVALTSNDPAQQTFAQGLATTIGGAIGGAFAGYAIGERKK